MRYHFVKKLLPSCLGASTPPHGGFNPVWVGEVCCARSRHPPYIENCSVIPSTDNYIAIPLTENCIAIPSTESYIVIPSTENCIAVPSTESYIEIPSIELSDQHQRTNEILVWRYNIPFFLYRSAL